jgi:UDP-N-acetyl-D-glucosamine dehydrogenase
MSERVAIIGQGYVGLPLAMAALGAGHTVYGIDSDTGRVDLLLAGKSPVADVVDSEIVQYLGDTYFVGTGYGVVSDCSIVIVCVPTPLDDRGKPDISYLIKAVNGVAGVMNSGALLIIESTIEPGTIREVIAPKVPGVEVVYSPERIDPGNKTWTVKNTPKLVAGLSKEGGDRAAAFYSTFISDVRVLSSVEVIETAKLLENSFRLVNVSFINEISMFCDAMGIDVQEVIAAASSKPYGFMPFYPSAGVGGHCIPVDPVYLAHAAQMVGAPISSIDTAVKTNQKMIDHYLWKSVEKIGDLRGKKVVIVGIAYKPGVADVRESPALKLMKALAIAGADVSWHDDVVGQWNGEKSVALSPAFDLAIVVTPQPGVDLGTLGNVPVIDTHRGRG